MNERRIGAIRNKNDDSMNQSDMSSISRIKEPPKGRELLDQLERMEKTINSKRGKEEEIKKQNLLETLVARFEKLKTASITNTLN